MKMKALAPVSIESVQPPPSKRLIHSSNDRNESIVPIFGIDHMGGRISCGYR